MAVVLGDAGSVELKRLSVDANFKSTIDPADVQADLDRFSFDFPNGMLLTGDRVDIKATDDQALDFVDGWTDSQGSWYIHVDEVGGIRLYLRFDDAVADIRDRAVALVEPSRSIPVEVDITDTTFQCLADVRQFELNTSRDAVDVTELGEEFRKQHSTLISGSGTVTCLFRYDRTICDKLGRRIELPIYLHQLLLRLELGSGFHARFYLIKRGYGTDVDDEVWYEFDAFVTNVGVVYQPEQVVESTIQFVTSGEIKLLTKTDSEQLLLQEDIGRIVLGEAQTGIDEFDDFIIVEQSE